jgi:hypothetical protein
MTDNVLKKIIEKSLAAKQGKWGGLSDGEKLAAALVLNRADVLSEAGYTMAEAIDRLGPNWLAKIPEAARQVASED